MEIMSKRVLRLIKMLKVAGYESEISQGDLRRHVAQFGGNSSQAWVRYKEVFRTFTLFNEKPSTMLEFNWPNIYKLDADIARMTGKERVFSEVGELDANNKNGL